MSIIFCKYYSEFSKSENYYPKSKINLKKLAQVYIPTYIPTSANRLIGLVYEISALQSNYVFESQLNTRIYITNNKNKKYKIECTIYNIEFFEFMEAKRFLIKLTAAKGIPIYYDFLYK